LFPAQNFFSFEGSLVISCFKGFLKNSLNILKKLLPWTPHGDHDKRQNHECRLKTAAPIMHDAGVKSPEKTANGKR